jgi:cyclopropane fatty-acyl-phospholipid synthase-like methyltransferase
MDYLKLAEHYNECFKNHGDNHLGVDWPKYEDTLTRYKVMYELIKDDTDSTILDFGCGLGHFNKWLLDNDKVLKYSGLDINESFYNYCSNKYQNNTFYLKDILIDDNIPNFDYIVCNGTFTEKKDLTQSNMTNFMFSVLKKLWNKTNKGISFNVMSKNVEWERDDLYHMSMDEITKFLTENLSRNILIRHDYKLYEYTVYVYK